MGDDPRLILCDGTDGFGGLGGGCGMGVSVESSNELGHLFVALDASEGSFGVEHAGGGPAQHHLPVAPAGDVAVGGPGDRDHRVDRVAGGEGLGEPAVDAESGDGEHLFQAFAQRRGGAGVAACQAGCEGLGVGQALVGVGVPERLDQLGVDEGFLLFWQVVGYVIG